MHPEIKSITFTKKDSVISYISSNIVVPNKVCIHKSNDNQILININIANGSNISIQPSNISSDVINVNEYILNTIKQFKEYKSALEEKETELQDVKKQARVNAYDIALNISKFSGSLLKFKNYVISELPEAARTEDILLNISKMDETPSILFYVIFKSDLPEAGKTEAILLNLSKINDRDMFNRLGMFLRELPEAVKTEDILLNISKMNKYEMSWMIYIFNILNVKEMSKETLLNITKINNIKTLKDLSSVISNLQKEVGIKDLFLNISNNIVNMDETILSDIDNLNRVSYLLCLYDVLDKIPSDKLTTDRLLRDISNIGESYYIISKELDKLPESGKKTEILLNISNNSLHYVPKIWDELPEAGKTTEVFLNLSKMRQNTLEKLCYLLEELPEEGKTTEILKNISKINNKDTLSKLYNDLEKEKNDDEKMKVLINYKLVPNM